MSKLREFLESHRDLLCVYIETEQLGIIDENLYSQLYFDQDDIIDHVECQAGLVAWWGTVCRIAEVEYEELKHNYDMWFALHYETQYERLWSELERGRTQRPHISSVENSVRMKYRKEYNDWQRRLRTSKKQVAIAKDVLRWFEEKGQMLVQAAKYTVAEMHATDFRVAKEGREVDQLQKRIRSGSNN